MKRLLLISYVFPPLTGSGVFRPLRFAKYLPRHGWGVTVLCVDPRVRLPRDSELLRDVRDDVRVERTGTLEPRNALLVLNRLGLTKFSAAVQRWWRVPDDQRGWVPFAVRRARRVLEDVAHHAILSTSAPYSAHLVGRRLRRATGIPWIADFRDEWTTNPYFEDAYPTAWHRRLNERLERAVLREADAVVSVSAPWLAAHRALVPDQPDAKFHVHPNGFDADHHDTAEPERTDRFRILYAGTFYGHRSPETFLAGIRLALERGLPAEDVEIEFVGPGSASIAAGDLPSGMIRTEELRPYFETVARMRRATVLLLVVPRAGGPGNHTGKLFPYLATGRPILLQAPEPNVAADLVRESGSGVVVPPDDPSALADAVVGLHADWKAGRVLPDRDPSKIDAYEGSHQAERLARLLDRLTDARHDGSGAG